VSGFTNPVVKAMHLIYNRCINENERSLIKMATVNYSLRVDENDKQIAEQVFKSLGMTFSTGLNVYIKAVGRQQKIPFVLSLDGQVNSSLTIKTTHISKEQSFNTLNGILTGYEINLDQERTERITSQ
jgi:DNA-damage-inducible protein J